jgi:hypothetical protein
MQVALRGSNKRSPVVSGSRSAVIHSRQERDMALWRMTVDLSYGVGTGHGTNTWHLRSTGVEPDDTDLQDLVDAIKDWYGAGFAHCVPTTSHARFDGVLQEINSDSPRALAVTGFDSAGAVAANYAPPANQIVTTWRSTLSARSGRGRTFIGPVALPVFQDDGTVATATLTALVNAGNALCAASQAFSNGAVVVWSPTDNVGRDIIAATVTDQIAVLRSRRS